MQQNENALLQSMYDECQGTLRTLAVCHGVPYDEVEDIIQETFISYYQNYSLEWPMQRKKAMLTKILRNKCIDYYRRNSGHEEISVDDEDLLPGMELKMLDRVIVKDSLDSIINDESCQEIWKCITEMRDIWRDIAILYFVEERTIQEICEILDISGTVCRSRISRARKYLKNALRTIYDF